MAAFRPTFWLSLPVLNRRKARHHRALSELGQFIVISGFSPHLVVSNVSNCDRKNSRYPTTFYRVETYQVPRRGVEPLSSGLEGPTSSIERGIFILNRLLY